MLVPKKMELQLVYFDPMYEWVGSKRLLDHLHDKVVFRFKLEGDETLFACFFNMRVELWIVMERIVLGQR